MSERARAQDDRHQALVLSPPGDDYRVPTTLAYLPERESWTGGRRRKA